MQGTRARWTCDHCGTTGESDADHPADTVLCDVCGEPVTPD